MTCQQWSEHRALPGKAGEPTQYYDAISARARAKWEARGRPEGSALQDWLESESEFWRDESRAMTQDIAFEDILETIPDALVVADEAGIIRLVNAQSEELFGYRRAELLGKSVETLVPVSLRPAHQQHRAEFMAKPRKRPLGIGMEVFARRQDGTTVPVEISLSPISTKSGMLVIALVRDVTARKQVEQYLSAEHAIPRILLDSSGMLDAAPKLVRAIGESLGWEIGTFWSLDPNARVLRCAGFWQAPSIALNGLEHAVRQWTFAKGAALPGRVWADGNIAWLPDIRSDGALVETPLTAWDALHLACAFPIQIGSEFLGVMEFASRKVQESDQLLLGMMARIAAQIGQFLERRRIEEDLRCREHELLLAQQVQQSLLPVAMPVLPGFAFAASSRFCQETGGDYYDFFPLSDSTLCIAIGDASGHGIAAALVMEEIRSSLRALALTRAGLGSILTLVNRRLFEDLPTGKFATLLLVQLDARTNHLSYCSAGHHPGVVLDAQGTVRTMLPSCGIPLGVEGATRFSSVSAITLQPDDLVWLFTDGVTEAFSEGFRPFGIERALAVIRAHRHAGPNAIHQSLFRAIDDFCGWGEPRDDITSVIVKMAPGA